MPFFEFFFLEHNDSLKIFFIVIEFKRFSCCHSAKFWTLLTQGETRQVCLFPLWDDIYHLACQLQIAHLTSLRGPKEIWRRWEAQMVLVVTWNKEGFFWISVHEFLAQRGMIVLNLLILHLAEECPCYFNSNGTIKTAALWITLTFMIT